MAVSSGLISISRDTLFAGKSAIEAQRGTQLWGANWLYNVVGAQRDILLIANEFANLSTSGAFATDVELNSVSGVLTTEIDTDVDAVSGVLTAEIDTDVDAVSGVLTAEIDSDVNTVSGVLTAEIDSTVDAASGVLTAEIDSDVDAVSGVLTAEIDSDVDAVSGVLTAEIDSDVNAASGILTAEIDTDVDAASGAITTGGTFTNATFAGNVALSASGTQSVGSASNPFGSGSVFIQGTDGATYALGVDAGGTVEATKST